VVFAECGNLGADIDLLIQSGRVELIANQISATKFARAMAQHKLGAGEAECILLV
jgi:hypothetical protein